MDTNEKSENIILTQNELICLDDRLTLLERIIKDNYFAPMRGLGSQAEMAAEAELILKIGGALVACIDEKLKEIEVNFTEKELWIIREMANSNIISNEEFVGFNLKIKIHRALRKITNAFVNDEFIDAIDFKDKTKDNIKYTTINSSDISEQQVEK